MNFHLSLTPLLSLLAGILILIGPRLLNFIVAIYPIVIGILGLVGTGNLHLERIPSHCASPGADALGLLSSARRG